MMIAEMTTGQVVVDGAAIVLQIVIVTVRTLAGSEHGLGQTSLMTMGMMHVALGALPPDGTGTITTTGSAGAAQAVVRGAMNLVLPNVHA